MRIILGMAGGAILRRTLKLAINMTVLTGNYSMFANQLERKPGMIDLCGTPAIGRMTCGAFGSKLTVVMIIFQVAGDAHLGSGFQVIEGARIGMTPGTSQRRVLTSQFECTLIMGKTRSK